jgi:hypothetical protein
VVTKENLMMTKKEKLIVICFMERMQAHVAQHGECEDDGSVNENKLDITAWDRLAEITSVKKFKQCGNFGDLK